MKKILLLTAILSTTLISENTLAAAQDWSSDTVVSSAKRITPASAMSVRGYEKQNFTTPGGTLKPGLRNPDGLGLQLRASEAFRRIMNGGQ